jgi:hypothetical protein
MIPAPFVMGLVVLVYPGGTWPAVAQDESPAVVEILIRPSPPPSPALKYQLLPERSRLIPGNAALFYHRAIEKMLEVRLLTPSVRKPGQKSATEDDRVTEWISGPLAAIPLDEARKILHRYGFCLHEIELGAKRESCDWEYDSRTEAFELIITEIQEMRPLARLVALRIRVAVLENQRDEAFHWLQTGLAMGRHVSQGPFLIQALVGTAFVAILTKPMEDLVQAPAMPSLYWALANRPRPFINLSRALESERLLLERELPQLRELDSIPWSVQKGRAFAGELQSKLFRYAGISPEDSTSAENLGGKDWLLKMGVAAMVAQAYPEAKRALIAQGRSAVEVQAMPTVQVAAIHAYQGYQVFRDDIFKWTALPYHQAHKGMSEASTLNAEFQRRPLSKLFTLLVPAIRSACMASARSERQLDAIQCIEAIRIYAAVHHRFPARLEDIAEAPPPIDPMTGNSFEYRLEGDHATLAAPFAPGAPRVSAFAIHYELKLAP